MEFVRIRYVSDLHAEHGSIVTSYKDPVGREIAVFAGDIDDPDTCGNTVRFIAGDRPCIFVAGNHEFYKLKQREAFDKMRVSCAKHNVHFLENDSVEIYGIRFLGCTLWTDFELFGLEKAVQCAESSKRYMIDYELIKKNNGSNIEPSDTRAMCLMSKAWLEERLSEPYDGPTVVVTHHTPIKCGNPKYWPKDVDNMKVSEASCAAFSNGWRNWMERLPNPPVAWFYGHNHTSEKNWVEHISGKRILVASNQFGYRHEQNTGYSEDAHFDIEVKS